MKNIRFALIGAGRWGKIYIQTVTRLPNMEISALCTSNIKNEKLVSKNCHVFSKWQDVLTMQDIDALILAVPPSAQFTILMANSKKKLPVMLEKPLSLNAKEAIEIESLYTKQEIISLVDHIYLFHPAYTALKDNLYQIGNIQKILTQGGSSGPFRSHTPPLWDYGPHDLSMCLDIAHEYPIQVSSSIVHSEINKDRLEEVWKLDLEFSNGVHTTSIVGNGMKRKTRRIEVIGEKGKLIFDNFDNEKLIMHQDSGNVNIPIPEKNKLPLDIAIETFSNAIAGKQDSRLGLTLGANIVTILEQCLSKN